MVPSNKHVYKIYHDLAARGVGLLPEATMEVNEPVQDLSHLTNGQKLRMAELINNLKLVNEEECAARAVVKKLEKDLEEEKEKWEEAQAKKKIIHEL